MYNGQIYYYWATGFNEPLPADYNYVGCVDKINNLVEPIEDFYGCRLSKGQRIYANPDNDSVIYVQYEDGFARFSISLITEEAKKENTEVSIFYEVTSNHGFCYVDIQTSDIIHFI